MMKSEASRGDAGTRNTGTYSWKETPNMPRRGYKEPHAGHSKHLCALIAGGSGYTVVKPLVKDPEYICAKCGRAAREKSSLCAPRKM